MIAFTLYLLATMVVTASTSELVNESYLKDNQIMFREAGTVINKAVFVHVEFKVNMSNTLRAIEDLNRKLQKIHNTELQNQKFDILPYLRNEGKDSIWRPNEANALFKKRALDGVAITGMLNKMFNRSSERLKGALKVLPRKYDVNEGQLFHKRQKRFILGGAALGMSSNNLWRIDRLEQSFSNMSSKYNMLVDSVSILSDKHVQLAVDTALLKDLMLLIEHKNYHKIITQVLTLEDTLKDVTSDVRSIVRAGQRGRLSNELLEAEEVEKLFVYLQTKAEAMGCRMIIEQPSDIFELDSTYGYDDNGETFAIFLHVPMYEKGEELKLWEYVPFPILQSIALNATILPQTKKENFIALQPIYSEHSQKTVSPHMYRVFDKNELNTCARIRDIYLCGGRNTVRTDITESCIGSLYLKDHRLIAKNCDLEIGQSKEYVAKIDVNKWVVFSPEKFSVNAKCGEVVENVRIETQTLLELAENCKLQLRSTQLTTDVNIHVQYHVKRFEWEYDGSIFEELNIKDEEIALLIQDMIATKSNFGLKDLNHLKHYYTYTESGFAKVWEKISSAFGFIAMIDDIMLALFITGAILILMFMYLNGYCGKIRVCIPRRKSNNREGEEETRRFEMERMDFRRNSFGPNNDNFYSASYCTETPIIPTSPSRDVSGSLKRIDSSLSVDSKYDPNRLIRADRERGIEKGMEECNPGPVTEKGRRIEDWVCNQHPLNGRPNHCLGYYSEKGDKSQAVRFQT